MIGAILVTINIGFFGLVISYFFGLKMWLEQRVATGLLIGFIFLSYLSFAIANFWGMSSGTLALTILVINLCVLAFLRKRMLSEVKDEWYSFKERYQKRSWQIFGGFLIILILFFGYLAVELLTFKDGTYFIQPVHAYGDISLHLGIISSFVYGNNFLPQNPNFSGTPISYPFMIDFLTAFFVSPLGMPVEQAVAFTGSVLFSLLIVLLVYFVLSLTQSKKMAILSAIIFLFNGGFGFIYTWQQFISSGKNIFDFLFHLPQDYTAIKDIGYWWINLNLSMLLPQRSFLFGFGVSILILTIFLQLKPHFQIKGFILGVILLAFLPLIHAHSLVALAPFILYFLFFIFKKQKPDRIAVFLIGLNGLVIAYLLSNQFLAQSGNIFSLFSWEIGWMSGQESVVRFYLKNFGVILLILPFAYYFLRKNKPLFSLGLLSLIWLFLPSVMIFQPWDFDNIKLFVYWYFFASILTASFLVYLFKKGWWQKILVGVVVILLTLSGFLDLLRVFTSSGTRYSIYGSEAIQMSEFVKQNTSPSAVFLSVDKFDNPVVSLAGRKVVMGFTPWLWTYGIDFAPRQQEVTSFLGGQEDQKVVKKYHITHVILFSNVQSPLQNQQFFDLRYKLIYDKDGYRIYEL